MCAEIVGADTVTRAQRFPIRAVVQYRVIGGKQWYVGTVENMSSTGVLFRGEQAVQVNSSIEIAVDMLRNQAGRYRSKMVSRGKVIRISADETDPETTVIAAAFSRLRIMRD